jgi:hypothetical protein
MIRAGRRTFRGLVDSGASVSLIRESLYRTIKRKQNAKIYFDLRKTKSKNEYLDLEDDIHIASIIRVATTTILKAQTVNFIQCKVKKWRPRNLKIIMH